MTSFLRGAAALLCAVGLALASPASAADKTSLDSDRDRTSYMIGMDVGQSMAPVAPDLDLAAFERAVRNALAGGEPLLAEAEAAQLAPALMQRVAARSGQRVPGLAPGAAPPEVDKAKVGLLMGLQVGGSLAPIREEFDLAVMMQGLRTTLAGGTPLLTPEQHAAASQAFQQQLQEKQVRAAEGTRKAGEEFLARNRGVRGVVTQPSGLQYQVLRQGAGRRPMATDRVRVHYRGTLLDGTVFDSSYERGQAAEFGLRQVIAGWTEGLTLMPIGAKYRFWIPSGLAYGRQGQPPAIPPNSVLMFEVELLDIL
jgi:FKBP-type peptidyl-prolyl cis-trans isomerase FkpA